LGRLLHQHYHDNTDDVGSILNTKLHLINVRISVTDQTTFSSFVQSVRSAVVSHPRSRPTTRGTN